MPDVEALPVNRLNGRLAVGLLARADDARVVVAEEEEVDFSVMSVSDTPVSVVFDIRYQGRQYNFQSGYQENYCKSVALGTLHFGYQIEAAFNNPAIQFYDFMAGKGKNCDYKKKLVNRTDEFATLLLVRSHWLKQAYKLQSLLRRT